MNTKYRHQCYNYVENHAAFIFYREHFPSSSSDVAESKEMTDGSHIESDAGETPQKYVTKGNYPFENSHWIGCSEWLKRDGLCQTADLNSISELNTDGLDRNVLSKRY